MNILSGKNPIVSVEIGCMNQTETSDFYANCFDWKISRSELMDTIDTQAESGINGHITSTVTEVDHYTIFYIQVENVIESLTTIKNNGGEMMVPPIQLTDGRTFAWFKDIAGNTVGLISSSNA